MWKKTNNTENIDSKNKRDVDDKNLEMQGESKVSKNPRKVYQIGAVL